MYQATFQLLGEQRADPATAPSRYRAIAFDLQVDAAPHRDGLAVHFAYATDLFDAATVARMAGHYGTILRAVAADPDLRVDDLDMLTPPERAQLARWNDTGAPIPDACVHELVAARARRSPDATAIEHAGVAVSYAELVARADRLAARLVALRAGGDRPVAVLLERGVDLVVAQLAALRAGSAYLPLDVATPGRQLARILDRGGPVALVTCAAHAGALPVGAPPLVLLDRPPATEPGTRPPGTEPGTRPPAAARLDALAYLIATSGTTGTPKLVEVEHRGLANLTTWHHEAYAMTARDRTCLLAAASFDASVWEIWPCLAAGATLVVTPEDVRRSPRDLLDSLVRERITLCFLPTPLAEAVLAQPLPDGLALRALLTGGDVLSAPPGRALPFALVNHYGPTECSVVATCATVGAEDPPGVPPPIGAPIRNVEAHVLDRRGRPQPIGVPGELHLAGAGLARGYRDEPAQTAAAFVTDPSGRRLYRTGDLVCRALDGRLRFLGRLDDQLKVRGIRVERGELVAALRSHPSVRDATVVRDGEGLAAFVVARAGAQPGARDLREHLARRLPAGLVPASYTLLDELPLTAHGKVDHAALPAPAAVVGSAADGTRTATERDIAAIFAELLGATSVGPHDDFFDLGGHSLLAIRLVGRIHASLGVELAVRRVFEAGTVRALAAAVDADRGPGRHDSLPAPRPAPRRPYRATLDANGELVLDDALRAALLGGTAPA